MSMGGNEGELDALVDSILQTRHASASNSISVASAPQGRAGASNSAAYASHGTAAPAPPRAPLSAGRRSDTTKTRALSERSAEEEEDLNALVQRILAGPANDAAAERTPPSTSTTSSPRLFSQALHGGPTTSHRHPPRDEAAPLYQPVAHFSQHAHRAGGARPGGGFGVSSGAVRVDPANARSLSSRMSDTSAVHRMHAVVRRLALWQERKEAKRVQAVYEALEQEQLACTFEPATNYAVDPGASPLRHSSGRPVQAATISMSSSSSASSTTSASSPADTASSPRASAGLYIPALEPPAQPITGADAFIDRLRRAQEERDAAREAEEARRLQYYDSSTFQRDPTVPAPFTLGDMRPRRVVTATAAVAGVPSPLRRSAGPDGLNNSVPRQVPQQHPRQALRSSPSQHSNNAYRAGAPGYKDALSAYGQAHRYDYDDEEGQEGVEEGEGREEGEERLTAVNTFLTLAPHIRQTLLFDSHMDQQLHRATASIRRAEEGA